MNEIPLFSKDAGETRSAIATFEQILDAFPDDVATLEALYQAYESLGNQEESGKFVLRTAQAIEQQPGIAVAASMMERLRAMAPNNREAERLASALQGRISSDAHYAPAASAAARIPELTRGSVMEAEMALAWKLKEEKWIPEKEYAQLVQDLAEISASDPKSTLSLLHIMRDREIPNWEAILTFIARDAGVGILPVSSFEPHPDAKTLLPLEFVLRQGAIIFDLIGTEALVAILNPYNQALRDETERLSGKKCHFYLTPPAEFDVLAARARDQKT